VIAPEDFIIVKCLSTRDSDLWDASAVYHALGERLNEALIAKEIKFLAAALGEGLAEKWEKVKQKSG
jgi:hypothetical protein